MNNAIATKPFSPDETLNNASKGSDPSILTDIYEKPFNIAIWQRTLSQDFQNTIARFVEAYPLFQLSMTLSVEKACSTLMDELKRYEPTHTLANDIAQVVDMFCCLFEQERVGLRVTVLSKAMCPRFHVDHVPCRLVTSYVGEGSQWLPNEGVDRTKLGHGSGGLADHESGLYQQPYHIQQLNVGDVALLKGERWEGNEGSGLIHRSPELKNGIKRLLLTIDFND